MDIQLSDISINDCVDRDGLNLEGCRLIFGDNVNWEHISRWKVDRDNPSLWVWNQRTIKASLASSIYSWINSDMVADREGWEGRMQIWKLCTSPRVKVFNWRMVHRRTPTFAYLCLPSSAKS